MIALTVAVALGADPGEWAAWDAGTDAGQLDAGAGCIVKKCRFADFGECRSDGTFVHCPSANEIRAERQAATLNALTGFQKTEWGMSQAAVAKLAPKVKASVDGTRKLLTMPMQVSGLNAAVQYVLESGRLVTVSVAFENDQKGYPGSTQVCEAVDKALREKYRDPHDEEEKLDGWHRVWRGDKTLIVFDCDSYAIPPTRQVQILYVERAFLEAKHDVKSDDL